MRTMKTTDSLTDIRGMTDSVMNRWILSMPFVNNICTKLELFVNHYSTLSELHEFTILRDDTDVEKLFSLHMPFPDCHCAMSIATKITGGDGVNCQKAYEIGFDLTSSMIVISISNLRVQVKLLLYPQQLQVFKLIMK